MMSSPTLPPPFDPNRNFQPVWRQAFHWLDQCHVLSHEAKRILNSSSSTIEDLADILSDGIVLCNLLNYLVPGIIKYTDVSCRPQRSRFLCLQNIRLFLDTCRRELNFRERDLFDPYMLFDKYDLDRIVETLSKISRLEIAKKKKLIPFPQTNSTPVNYVNTTKEDETSIVPMIRSLDDAVPMAEPAKFLQRQSSLCHSCRYARIHHVPSFLSTNPSAVIGKTDASFLKTTSSTNLTESVSSPSMVVANAASTLSSAAATTENNQQNNETDEMIQSFTQHRLSTSSLPFSILNGDSGVYGSRISIADDVYEQLCEKPKKFDNHKAFLPRDHCVKELLDTELNYRDSLHQIVKFFIEPLQLKSEEQKKIFLNISEIYDLHKEFYDDLRSAGRNEKGRTSRIVELFTRWQDRFLIYARYCSELPDAQEFLDRKIKQDANFAAKLEQCRQKAGELGKFQLRDTVVLPFQRIVKYSLLLHTMKKNVPFTDANGEAKRQDLEKAEQLMIDVNQYINEAKRAHDNLKVISNIEKTICDIKLPAGRCLRGYGRFICDEQFTVYDNGHRNGTRTVFLLDQILLICKVKGSEKYTFRAALLIHDCYIEELKATKREFPFILRDNRKSEFKFVAKTEEKRSYWLKNLRDAIDRCSNSELFENGHNFQMKTFDETNPRCQLCNRYLCGLFYQGYECVRCQKRLHRECIRKIPPCLPRVSIERMRSFDRGSIELPRAFSNAINHHRTYALYNFNGTINNTDSRSHGSRLPERQINVTEGDELEVIEDDDEQMWKVKNLRTNEIGLIPATIVGFIDGDLQRSSIISSEISSTRSNLSSTLAHHFPFIRSLVQAYSAPTSSRLPYGNPYSSALPSNNTEKTSCQTSIPIQRSKSISSSTTSDHLLSKHRSLQLSSSFDNTHLFSESVVPIVPNNHLFDWYLDISRHRAEDILRQESIPNNTFLVRKQGKNEGHAISIKHNNEVYHIRIYTQEVDGSIKHYLVEGLPFDSLQLLIQYYQTHSLEDRFPPVKSSLVHPIACVCNHDMLMQPTTL